jgi:TetR/AcrR family transcriptional regulator, regulator of autoinduction and epiphytic fitness
MDEVAAEVGIAKASLYKHFVSKESLAAAAMVRLLEATVDLVDSLDDSIRPIDRVKRVLAWALLRRLEGNLPLLPSTNSALRETLTNDHSYMAVLNTLSDKMGSWIESAQSTGDMPNNIPAIALLYGVYARTCDPTVDYLKLSGEHSNEQIVEWMIEMSFGGLGTAVQPKIAARA